MVNAAPATLSLSDVPPKTAFALKEALPMPEPAVKEGLKSPKVPEAAAPAPAPEKAVAQTVTVEFGDGGDTKVITFSKRHLGMLISCNPTPPQVKQVKEGCHAAEMGVREGWQVRKLQGEDVTTWDKSQLDQRLAQLVELLPRPSFELSMEFQVGGSSEVKNIVFSHGPLGLKFLPLKALAVDEVDSSSYAFRMGVRSGWMLLKVAGEDVTQKDWSAVVQSITELSSKLQR